MGWVPAALTSEFLWGTVLGVVLSVVTASAQMHFQRKSQANTVRKFADDLISNLVDYAESLAEARERSSAIHYDILVLIEGEISIWGRNREHLIVIESKDIRKSLRNYFARCAKLVVDTKYHLEQFNKLHQLAIQNNENEDSENRKSAIDNLGLANQSCDKLVSHIRSRPMLDIGQ